MENSFSHLWQNMFLTFFTGVNDWGSLHPLIVHFPIALLFIAPLFIIIGLIFQKSAKLFYISALILLLAGTLGIYLAASSGEEASELIKPTPAIAATLETHEHLAEKTRLFISILTSIFLTYLLLFSFFIQKFNPRIHQLGLFFFLIIYSYTLLLLFNTAHQGGKLVHYHGVTSKLYVENDQIK